MLAILQRDGRLVDFLMEDLGGVFRRAGRRGGARRARGCRQALDKYADARAGPRGGRRRAVTVERAATRRAIKVVGNAAGAPPFRGVLRHRGWEATRLELPPLPATGRTVIAPAEVEVAVSAVSPWPIASSSASISAPPTAPSAGSTPPAGEAARVPHPGHPAAGEPGRSRGAHAAAVVPLRAGRAGFPAGSLALPWDASPRFVTGELARRRGAESGAAGGLGEVVAVARRREPDRADPAVGRAGRGPAHLAGRRLRRLPEAPRRGVRSRRSPGGDAALALAQQDVLLTVPASFDARRAS